MTTATELDILLAIVRLGDLDRLGWWRSRSTDETAEYVLGEAFPATWLATGVELGMESARVRHDQALAGRVGRTSPLHLFSDQLPFHQRLRSWLIERKLERDPSPLEWIRKATTDDLLGRLGSPLEGERRADGLFMGTVEAGELEDSGAQQKILVRLSRAYRRWDPEFVAPYLDVVT